MGDGGTSTPWYPAALPQGILAVGAVNSSGEVRPASNTGPHIDVVAPGENAWTTSNQLGVYAQRNGTGVAAAYVSGLAALLLSHRPDLDNDDVEQIIRLSAKHPDGAGVWDDRYGTGIVNASAAFDYLKSPWRLYHREAAAVQWWGYPDSTFGPWLLMVSSPGYFDGQLTDAVPAAEYYAARSVLEVWSIFPVVFTRPPHVWGRGAKSQGFSRHHPRNIAYGWCGPAEVYRSAVKLITYQYVLYDCAGTDCSQPGAYRGYVPAYPTGELRLAYSVLGELDVSDAGEADSSNARDPLGGKLQLTASNPFGRDGSISVLLPQTTKVRLAIFDVAGRRAEVLYTGLLVRGRHDFRWDRTEENGKRIASGLYIVEVQVGSESARRKLLVLK